jgi:hypothetical protein
MHLRLGLFLVLLERISLIIAVLLLGRFIGIVSLIAGITVRMGLRTIR